MEIGYPVTSCEESRQESFRRHVPITYRTFYEGQPTALGAREVGIARLAFAVTLDTWDASLVGQENQIQGVERCPRHRDFARKAVATTQHLNTMLVRMFKRQSVYAKRKYSRNMNPHLVKALGHALRHLHQSAEILTLVTTSLDTLEKRQSVTRLVGDIDALQQRLGDLIESRDSDKPIIPPKPFG